MRRTVIPHVDVATQSKLVGFRLEPELVAKIDAYAKRLSEENPGISFTRSDAARRILLAGLEQLGKPPRPRKR
jgi:hypothetical protein